MTERGLLRRAVEDPSLLGEEVIEVMEPPFHAIPCEEPVREAVEILSGAGEAVLVTDGGLPVGIVTRADLVESLAKTPDLPDDARFATRAVRRPRPDPSYGGVVPAIHQASTYVQASTGEFVRTTTTALRESHLLGARERARRARGRARLGVRQRDGRDARPDHRGLRRRDHVIIPADLYGGTYRLVDKVLARWGLEYDLVDQTDPDAVAAALRPETKLVWVETPTNPLLNVVDIPAVVERAGDALVCVDSTFATPVVQRPLELGAGAVMHSTTKYLAGTPIRSVAR